MPYAADLSRFPAYLQQLADGEQRQARRPRRARPGRPDRSDHLGRAGDRRPAFVLPAHPSGHEADPVRHDRLLPSVEPGRRAARPPDGEPVRPGRGARLRQDGGGAGGGRVGPGADAFPRLRGQPADQHDPGRPARLRIRSARWWRSTSTTCSPRARSGASTRSTSGASSSARSSPSASRRSLRPGRSPRSRMTARPTRSSGGTGACAPPADERGDSPMPDTISLAAPDGSLAEAIVYPDLSTLIAGAAECIADSAAEAIAARGSFNIALSGGNTPKPVYQRLASAAIDWDARACLLRRRTLRAARRSAQQLPHGAGRAARPRRDPGRERASHAWRGSSGGGGRGLRGRASERPRRRRAARSRPSRPRSRRTYGVAVPRPCGGDRDAARGDGGLRRVCRHVASDADPADDQCGAPGRRFSVGRRQGGGPASRAAGTARSRSCCRRRPFARRSGRRSG